MYVRADVRGVNMPDSTNDSFEITAEQIQEILKKENMRQRKRASKKKKVALRGCERRAAYLLGEEN